MACPKGSLPPAPSPCEVRGRQGNVLGARRENRLEGDRLTLDSDTGHRKDTPLGRPQAYEVAAARLRYLAGGWALLYAAYRGYYALGGTIGMFGTPVSLSQWRQINGIAAVLLLLAAILPLASVRLWCLPRARTVLLALGWVIAVGCVMHALVDIANRLLTIAGVIHMEFPFFVAGSVDRRAADAQDLFLNEPWFLIEGVLWGALCLVELTSAQARRWWLASALAAIAVLTVIGVLSGAGVIGRFIIG